ncbi:hypothetical protein ACFSUH_43995 [Rhodococcus jostii]|uniref:hypothetical protein n=1 Tax=Rhodococcus jostii TaxID=132919 RepID=UPI00362F2BD6
MEQLDAGTPPYRDPFLGTGIRTAYDSAAERYSAAVVLYEMATATTPTYGDGMSDPRVLDDDVSVTPEDFTAGGLSRTRAEALSGFFRTALARNVKDRFDTAAAMRQAWAEVFKAQATEPTTEAKPPKPEPTPAPPIAETYTSLGALAAEFARAAGSKPTAVRRQVVELVLGTHAQSPDDPFVTYQVLAPLAGVSSGRIAQIFGEFTDLWAKNPQLSATVRELYGRGQALLESSGGATTPDLLARELASVLATDGVADPQRISLGVVRLLLASAPATAADTEPGTDTTLHLVRRHGSGTVAMISTAAVPRKLPAALAAGAEKLVDEALAQGSLLVTPAQSELPLRAAAAAVLDVAPAEVEIPGHALLRIASTASTEVALSARDELHAGALPIGEAFEDAAARVVDVRLVPTRAELETRVAARFPALTKSLPRRPELDAVVQSIVSGHPLERGRDPLPVRQCRIPASYVPTRHTRTAPMPQRSRGTTDTEFVLASSVREHTFRALGVPMGSSDAVAAALAARFGARHLDVTELLLGELHRRAETAGIPWEVILAADAGAATDREGLKGFVSQAIPALVDAVNAAGGPVVLTDLSTLAAYGHLHVVREWADLTSPPPHAVWALVPQPEESVADRVRGWTAPRCRSTVRNSSCRWTRSR